MLIVPIENRPDWTRPPVMTLTLILINLAVFLFYQGQDNEIMAEAAAIYQKYQLLDYEREPYLDYLRTERPADFEEVSEVSEAELQSLYITWSVVSDRNFDRYLREQWRTGTIPDSEITDQWRRGRDKLEQTRNQISAYRGGLTPAESKPLTFITSQFLHGGWDHLLGNMVFLFLFGFTLEAVLRPHLYLLMYLLSGLAANGLHMLFNADSMVPVIGASGAISGLMGMYLALYKLRSIRFFYNFLFFFGEFRAPALFILPLWVAKELYGHFYVESSTAYWAHIGGLLTGAALMFLVPVTQKQFARDLQTKDQDDDLAQALKKVQLAMANLDFSRAKTSARRLCQSHPHDPRPWHLLFNLHKGQPNQKPFHQVTFELLKQFISPGSEFTQWQPHLDEVLRDYQALAPKMQALNGSMSLALARHYWRNRQAHQSEEHLQRAAEKGAPREGVIKLLRQMLAHYEQRRQNDRAAPLAKLLKQLSSKEPAEPARE